MIKSIQTALVAILSAALVLAAPAFAQQIPSYIGADGKSTIPVGVNTPLPVNATVTATATFANFKPTGNATLAVTTTSARVALPSADTSALVRNTGSTDAYLAFGGAGVTATTSGVLLKSGDAQAFDVTGSTYVAAITGSSTSSLAVSTGTGSPVIAQAGGAGGGGGAVTIADGAAVTQGALADAACGTDTGTCSAQALVKRLIQRLTTINTTLSSPFQAGGSIGNTTFASTQSGTWNVGLTGTLPAFAATPTFNCGTGCGSATNWTPVSTVAISPTSTSAATALPSADPVILVQNRGPRVVFAKLGTVGVTATATDMPIMPGSAVVLAAGANTYIGLLNQGTGTGSTGLVYVTTGTGTPNLSGDTSMVSNQDPLEGNGKDRFVPIVGVDHWKAVFRGLALDTAALTDKSVGVLAANIPYTETSTPLTAGSTYTGGARQAKYQPSNLDDGYAFAAVTFRANIIADQAGNCWLEHSPNGSTWYKATPTTAITASVPVTLTVATTTYAYRVVCTNGGTNQGSFFVSSSFATH